jgi:hypothetical protein
LEIISKSNSIIDIQELSDYRMLYVYDKMKSELSIKKQMITLVMEVKKDCVRKVKGGLKRIIKWRKFVK